MIITCVGDCGVDHYVKHHLLHPGGITLNFAVHARKTFEPTDSIHVVSVIGNDDESAIVEEAVQKYQLVPHIAKQTGTTPKQHIDHDKRGEKIFVKYEEGVLANYSIDADQRDIIQNSDFVMTVIYTQIEHFFKSAIMCKPKGLMAVDFMDLSDYGKKVDVVKEYIPYFDVAFFGLRSKEQDLIQSLQDIASHHNKLFVITLGPDGSMAQDKQTVYKENACPVEKVVDTTGAGDAFAAMFTKTFLYTHDTQKSLRAGNEQAAIVVQKLGSF